MLNVTDKAAAALRDTLEANQEEESQVLRLTSSGQGVGIALDEEQEGDDVVVYEDRKVLVIAPVIAEALDGATIDAVDTPQGQRLVLESPAGQ